MISRVFFLFFADSEFSQFYFYVAYIFCSSREGHLHHISFILILFLFRRCGEGADRIKLGVFI